MKCKHNGICTNKGMEKIFQRLKKGDASGIPVAYIVTVIILIAFLAFMFFYMRSNDSHLSSLTDLFSSLFRFN
jgi:hypothetical protein